MGDLGDYTDEIQDKLIRRFLGLDPPGSGPPVVERLIVTLGRAFPLVALELIEKAKNRAKQPPLEPACNKPVSKTALRRVTRQEAARIYKATGKPAREPDIRSAVEDIVGPLKRAQWQPAFGAVPTNHRLNRRPRRHRP